ncbi:hypothetical protein N185_16520 [Sinorhizobium sp. GW3]|nr:hypothetical protein N185_16520 [Sinorhizobium sp. GW3]
MKDVNIQAVADAAGVSKTTVSHVISGKRHVAEKTKLHVMQVMESLGFRPNFLAQALVTKRAGTIALVTHDILNPFYPALARGVQQAATSDDQILMLFDAGPNGNNLGRVLDLVKQRRIDGVIAAVGNADSEVEQLRAQSIPVVTVGPSTSEALDWVSVDDVAVGYDAVLRLYKAGHRRIALINGDRSAMPGSARAAGYRKALDDLGLAVECSLEIDGGWSRAGGAAAMHHLLDLAEQPTAAFCANDLMAIGAMDAAFTRGVAVPDGLALIGVDDIDAASLVRPALTTIRVPAHDIGVAAAERLLRRMDGDLGPAQHILLPHTLINRNTV